MESPVESTKLSISYYVASLVSTLIICLTSTIVCFIYLAITGWYLSVSDVLLFLLDVFLLSVFGTILSSIVNCFISTQGQMSAVGTIISSTYGFICGAYMPISSFPLGLQKVLSFLPGTYGTSLMRSHAMNGAIKSLEESGLPQEYITSLKDAIDSNVYFLGYSVPDFVKFLIIIITIILLSAVYILLNMKNRKKLR